MSFSVVAYCYYSYYYQNIALNDATRRYREDREKVTSLFYVVKIVLQKYLSYNRHRKIQDTLELLAGCW